MSHIFDEARAYRRALDAYIEEIKESPRSINTHVTILRVWTPGVYNVGDVRLENGIPYKCAQSHDSTANPAWSPSQQPALWYQYHGTTPETARPFIAPTGAHDMYQADEYMIWTDGNIYRCVVPTTYNPEQYAQAWELVSDTQ